MKDSKLQEKPSALKREHPSSSSKDDIFTQLDPDSESGSGSTTQDFLYKICFLFLNASLSRLFFQCLLTVPEGWTAAAPPAAAAALPSSTAYRIPVQNRIQERAALFLKNISTLETGSWQCWGSVSAGSAFGPPGSGSMSQRSGSGSFPFLINVLSGLK